MTSPVTRWEYQLTSWHDVDALYEIANALESKGRQGWELCAIEKGIAFFKRQIPKRDVTEVQTELMQADPMLNPWQAMQRAQEIVDG